MKHYYSVCRNEAPYSYISNTDLADDSLTRSTIPAFVCKVHLKQHIFTIFTPHAEMSLNTTKRLLWLTLQSVHTEVVVFHQHTHTYSPRLSEAKRVTRYKCHGLSLACHSFRCSFPVDTEWVQLELTAGCHCPVFKQLRRLRTLTCPGNNYLIQRQCWSVRDWRRTHTLPPWPLTCTHYWCTVDV